MKCRRSTILTAALAMLVGMATAAPSPEGVWRTIDDETGEARSLVEIEVVDGELQGHIREIIQSDLPEDEWFCTECEGEKQGQPFVGLRILEGLTWNEGDNEWNGGTITDPANGREYQAILTVNESNETLRVRGFIGFSLIGRTQVWERVQ